MRRVRARLVEGAVQLLRQLLVEDLVDQRALARAADAGHGDEQPERERDVHVLQVVVRGADDLDGAARRRPPRPRLDDAALAAQVGAGQRRLDAGRAAVDQLLGPALEDQLAAVLAGARTEVDQVVGGADRLFVVLDDDDAVALVAQPAQRGQQAPVVALVQADRRLVEHVEDAGQVGADLRRQADALPFPAGQRRGAAPQRQVADADVVEEAQAVADLAQQPAGDEVLALGELEALEGAQGVRDGQRDVLGDGLALDADGAALGPQALALAVGAAPQAAQRLQDLPIRPRAVVEAAAQVREQALEALAEGIALALGRHALLRRGRRARRCASARAGAGRAASSAACRTGRSGRCRRPRRAGRARRRRAPCRPPPRSRWRPRRATSCRPARRAPGRSPRSSRGPGRWRRRPAAS